MLEKVFKFSAKDLIKFSIIMIIATLLFGLPGLMIMIFFQWITSQSYAFEQADKHGISQLDASRFGGASVFAISLILCLFALYLDFFELLDLNIQFLVVSMSVLACMVLGLIDDLRSNFLSPKSRLISLFSIFALCLLLTPNLVPQKLGVMGLDSVLKVPIFGWFLAVVFCTGFVNAINMADGANGLIPGTITVAFTLFYLEMNHTFYAIFLTTCALFTIFNVISGRLFLGDAGAYGLGSLVALNGLYLYSERVFSAQFLAVLFAYPCIDIIVTVVRRKIIGNSIFLPDNDHLHNRIYLNLQRWSKSKTLANSITGLSIVSLSSGIALIGFYQKWWPVDSEQWAWVFLAQLVLYLTAFVILGLNIHSGRFSKIDS